MTSQTRLCRITRWNWASRRVIICCIFVLISFFLFQHVHSIPSQDKAVPTVVLLQAVRWLASVVEHKQDLPLQTQQSNRKRYHPQKCTHDSTQQIIDLVVSKVTQDCNGNNWIWLNHDSSPNRAENNTEAEAWFNALPALWVSQLVPRSSRLCQWCTKSEHQTPLPPAKTLYLR